MKKLYEEFCTSFPGTEQSKPLAPLTTLQIGGPADLYYKLTDIEELAPLLAEAKNLNIPVFVLGGGSNTVFHDDGFRGLIIHVKANKISIEGETIVADAGALLSQVLQAAIKNGLSGMENMMGLPGTVGGAVRGNAGAFGTETKDILQKALIFNEEKGVHEVAPDYLNFSYRTSTVKRNKGRDIVLRAWFKLKKGDTKAAMKEAAPVLAKRLKKQPAGKTSGSFFKNPSSELAAGYLLDQAGCKGLQLGQAQVSPQHANWIMNLGGATQKDILRLAAMMRDRVKAKFEIELEPEVQFVAATGMIPPSEVLGLN